MPFEITRVGKKYAVKTTAGPNAGHLHGLTTKPKAEAQMRLLEMVMKKTKHGNGSGHPHTKYHHV